MRFEIHSIEGNGQRLDGGAMFGNAPKALWQRWVDVDERNRIELACRAFLVIDHQTGRRILLETGIGYFFDPKLRDRYGVSGDGHLLLAQLEARGIGADAIDAIVLSHLHFDHAGGLLAPFVEGEPPVLAFPKAQVICGRRAFERSRAPHPRDKASFIVELGDLLEASGRLLLVDEGVPHPLGHGFEFMLSEGHTPGQLLTAIVGEQGGLVFCGDLIPGVPWLHPSISMGYDRYPERLIDEKRQLLERCYEQGWWLLFTHDLQFAAARLEKDDHQRFVAVDARSELSGLPV